MSHADRSGLLRRCLGACWDCPSLLLSLASLFWAGNFIVGRAVAAAGAQAVPPVSLAFWRWTGAFLVVALLGWRTAWKERHLILRYLPRLAWFGLLSVTLYNTLIYLGLRQSGALNALFLQSVMPLVVLSCSFLLFKEPVAKRAVLGIVLSLIGVVIILTRGQLSALLAYRFGQGDILILAAVCCNAVYFATLRKRPPLASYSFLIGIFGIGTLMLLPFMLWERAVMPPAHWQWRSFGAVAYLAIFASYGALACFNRGVALIGANRASPFLHLMPAFGSVLAILLLGERMYGFHMIGMAVICVGIVLATKNPTKGPVAARPSPLSR